MLCGSCGWDNPAGIIYCTNCGKRVGDQGPTRPAVAAVAPAPSPRPAATQAYDVGKALAASCPRCSAPSAPGLRFCRECGASLVDPAPSSSPQYPAVAPAAAPAAPQAPFAPTVAPGALPAQLPGPRLVTLLRDGSEGRVLPLGAADTDIGSREGDIVFADDPYLSPRHARISCRGGAYILRDLDSVNGVYVRLREPQPLRDRDMVLLGQQVLRFELLLDGELPLGPAWQGGVLVFGTPEVSRFARLVQYTTEGVGRDVHYLFRDETVIGRENGDIVFTDDPFLSRRHAAIRIDQARRSFSLHDLGSSNGTALRIRGEHVLRDGDQFRIGRHLFRFEAGPAGGRSER